MNKSDLGQVSDLVGQVEEMYKSEKNQIRMAKDSEIVLSLEYPICETILFDYDFRRCIADPVFYLEQTLKAKLWKWENIDDEVPIDYTIRLPFLWIAFSLYGVDISLNHKGVPHMISKSRFSQTRKLEDLEPVNYSTAGQMPQATQFYHDLIEASGGKLDIDYINYRHGPLDIAVQLIGYEDFILASFEDPDYLHSLLGFITEQRNQWFANRAKFLGRSIEKAVIADDWINIPYITPDFFRQFVIPCYKKIKKHHGQIQYIHSCGNATDIQGEIAGLQDLEFMEISPWSDLKGSLEIIPRSMPIHVRFHPNSILYASPKEMEEDLIKILDIMEDRPFKLRTTGLTMVYDTTQEFVDHLRIWTDLARKHMKI